MKKWGIPNNRKCKILLLNDFTQFDIFTNTIFRKVLWKKRKCRLKTSQFLTKSQK
jgi:hypothetical protein